MTIAKRTVIVQDDSGNELEKVEGVRLPHIKSIEGFLNGAWDYSLFDDCFPDKNVMGDIDGHIELHSHSLVLEFKGRRSALNYGQIIKAVRMARTQKTTTLFVIGKLNQPREYLRISPNCLEGTSFIQTNLKELRQICKDWAEYARRNNSAKNVGQDWNIAKTIMEKAGNK